MNCIIVDDEPIARLGIEDLISEYKFLNLLESFSNANSIMDYIQNNRVDLIFLDIEMPGIKGIDFAISNNIEAQIIFTTAYNQYALQSYEANAVDYLLKPIKKERFEKAVIKAKRLANIPELKTNTLYNNTIVIRSNRKNIKINLADILYIKALKDYVKIITIDDVYLSWINLKSFHKRLPINFFIRVNKSYIINIIHVSAFNKQEINLNDLIIPIGKKFSKEITEKCNIFFSNNRQ